ncbi:MAG: hypothetical protein IIX49_07335 [Oscillospiraceae bacterium]|nr:hypothetical protein [Oscillospiraceae bacterium]
MEEKKILPETEEAPLPPEEEKTRSMLQIQKESWYDKLPLNVKQLDIIITVCWILIAVVFLVIALDAMDIFNPFGY